MADPKPYRRLCSLDEVLRSGRLHDSFFGALSARFRLTRLDGTPLSTDLWKVRGVHVFLGPLTSEAAPVPVFAELTLLRVDQDGGAHILHSVVSVPVGPYDRDRRFFGYRGELPSEGLASITEIPVAFFGALCADSAVSREDHRLHLEVSPPLAGRRCHARGQASKNRDKASLDGDPPLPSFIWKGASARFRNDSSLYWPFKNPRTRRLYTGFSSPSRATGMTNMWRQPILNFPSRLPCRGSLCFFRRSSASKPSTPGPMPEVLHIRMRVRNLIP